MKTINFFKTALLTIALFVCGNVGAEIAYNANFANQTGASGSYSPNVTISLENQEWYASYCYFGSNEFRLGHNKTTGVVPSKFLTDQPQGASIEMLWDIANVTKISVLSEKSYGTTSDWYIFESTDGGSNWTQVATGAYTEGATWEYTTTSPKSNARYAFVITGTSSPRAVLSTITIEQTSTSSVSTPTFSVQTGKYTEAQNVTIDCATAEASIYYTIDGTEPSAASTPYSEAINISSTTTLKAIAIKDGESSAVATATYTFPTEVDNIAAFNQAENNDFVKITKPITVTYINGANVYAQDESGSMLIYDFNFAETEGLTNGSIINDIAGENTLYNGAPQMKNVFSYTLSEHISIIGPTTVETLSTTDVHKYVKLEDAQFDNSYSFTESSTINANLSTHGNIVVRNNFKNFNMNVNPTDKYDIVGFVSVYQDAPQIYPVSITITTPSFMISTDALNFDEVGRNQTKTLEFTLQGVNLTENVTLNLSGTNAGYFEYTPQSISVNEDGSIEETTISVTYKPTELGNNHTATLTITSSGLNKTITLQGSCIKTVLPTPVATEATAITANGFTANWEAVDNATNYEVNVWTEEEPAFSVANSSFENDLENWEAEEGYSLSTNNAHTGSQSLAFDVTKTYDLRQTIKNLTPGEEITLSYWYYLNETSSGSGLRFWCTWEGSEDKSLQPTTYSNKKGAWTQATITTTVPEGATALNLEIRVYNGAKGYIDDITVTPANGNTITPITGSPFTVEGATSKEITGLTAETTYYYNVVAKADGYTASEASNTVEVKTLGEPTYAITGEGVTFDEATGYTLELGEVVLNDVTKEFTLTASNYNSSISLSTTRGLWKLAETAATGDLYTFTPDENGSINANLTVSFKTTEEMMGTTIEDLINYEMIAYGSPQTEQWAIIIDGKIDNYLYISFTPTEESTGTGLCNQPEMEGVTFNGEEIINSLNLDVVVYNAIGQMVVRSNENINMSSYPAGVYVIKAANGASMKIVK